MLVEDGVAGVLIAFITGVLGPILLQYVKAHMKKKEEKDPLMSDIEYDATVTLQIENLKDEFDADRVWIDRFHNGGNFNVTGKSMNKFSMVYESVSPGVSSTMSQFQNIPTSLFAKSLSEVMKKGELAVTNFDDKSKYTFGLRDVAATTGCQSLLMVGLKCPASNKYLGILGIEYVKDTHEFTEQEKLRVKEIGAFLAGVFSQQQGKH